MKPSAVLCKICFLLLISQLCFAQKMIAITIDDLPFVGEARNFHLNRMIDALQAEAVPATGFIIAKEVRPDNWAVLYKFRDAGFGLGNHTFSHANLSTMTAQEYIQQIRQADRILAPVLTEPRYFRYPYLAMASGEKREQVLCYLAKKHYDVAPITVDSKDFMFNQRLMSVAQNDRRGYFPDLEALYLDFIWQKTLDAEKRNPNQAQILLIHANLLNAYALSDIIRLYKENNYQFVTLTEALSTFKQVAHCQSQSPQLVKVHEKYHGNNLPSVEIRTSKYH